ncbi:hypothetical protein GSI_06467 [Ganoderma sinense ZZ0214-1]|uniref:Conserved oligomeric Golgi complex subunit 1 n=1 Tax=Ganoderma sinense ZZ0214-1 TaxID=1077348 RepID=A0A2G8SDE2_9APHY|nr:hypothetical protein GSI_06467 [Ganoderma sinense ZZ0214-1]
MARRPSTGSTSLLTSPEFPRQNGTAASTPKRPPPLPLDNPRRPSIRSTSATHKLDILSKVSNIDPDDLFVKHNVSEIRTIQQRLRADADAKQEELRLMVGERYRDLLQASTSILALDKSSQHVLDTLEEMRGTVKAISPARSPKRTATGEDKHLQALQSLSAHVKLLLDAPEHLWRLMERKSYLNAAWLFLLARVVHRALSQESDDRTWHSYGVDVQEHVPLVQRQWDTITPFRSQISHRATLSLREANSTPGEVCATLLTLHLLESRPLPETLSIYLAQRTKTLSGLLARNASTSGNGSATDAKSTGKVSHRPRKVVLRETKQKTEALLDAISRTVSTARFMFADDGSATSCLMKQALQFFQAPSEEDPGLLPQELRLTTQTLLTTLPSSNHFLLLPQSIQMYKPYIDGASVMTSTLQSQLREKLEDWFRKLIQDVRGVFADWFASLETVREMWGVRDSLLTWLKNTEGLDSSERQELESIINTASQIQATCVWKGELEGLETMFRNAVVSATETLEQELPGHVYGTDTDTDIQPVKHLFLPPPMPSLQTSAQSSIAAVQFSKYKSALCQQLAGRTPLLNSTLVALERHASDIQKDLVVMLKSGQSGGNLVVLLSSTYRTDAEAVCDRICGVLEHCIKNEVFRERLRGLHAKLIENWQECTVSRIFEVSFSDKSIYKKLPSSQDDTASPTQPSHALTQALLSLSSEMQQLGVCLDEDCRRQRAGSMLCRFCAVYLSRLPPDASHPKGHRQVLWDLAFLEKLSHVWGKETFETSQRIATSISSTRNVLGDIKAVPQSDIAASAQEYLSRTQILLAGLLPSHASRNTEPPEPAKKTEKSSALLLYGTPAAEARFEPALELVKPPPRLGLLHVPGVSTVR